MSLPRCLFVLSLAAPLVQVVAKPDALSSSSNLQQKIAIPMHSSSAIGGREQLWSQHQGREETRSLLSSPGDKKDGLRNGKMPQDDNLLYTPAESTLNIDMNTTGDNAGQQEMTTTTTEEEEGNAKPSHPKPHANTAPQAPVALEPFTVPGFQAVQYPTSAPKPGDFENLNNLLANTVFQLGDADINEALFFQPINLILRNLECSRVHFWDIILNSEDRSKEKVGIQFAITDLSIQCEFDFAWSYIFLSGNGHSVVQIGDSSINATMDMESKDFTNYPPTNATVTSCETDINIVSLDFSGNIASVVFNMLETSMIGALDGLINEKMCVELKNIGSTALDDFLVLGFGYIEPFLEPAEAWRYNSSYPELAMELSENTTFVSWTDEDGIGEFFAAALDKIDSIMGGVRKDELFDPLSTETSRQNAFSNGTKFPPGYDLGINVLLRSYLLDDSRAFVVNSEIPLYEGMDTFTDSTLTFKTIKVHGLDTFTHFEPFTRIHNLTLQNAISWDFISFEAVLELEIKASSHPDSLIRDPERVIPYVEEMTVNIGIQNIDAIVSVLIAIDPALVQQLNFGSILDLETLLPCAAASLHDVSLTNLNVSIGDIRMPTVEGLISEGVDRVVVDAVDAAFYMVKGTFLKMIPSLFQTTIRDLLNDVIEGISCPPLDLPANDSLVDLRDILLEPKEAYEAGGSGLAPYGDLAAAIYGIGQGMWQEVEEDGTLGLNEVLVRPISASTSNRGGLFSLSGELANFTTDVDSDRGFKTLLKRFEVSLFDLNIYNLDTVVHPMAILQPMNHPYITQSTINIGPIEGRPLNATVSMLFALEVPNSPLDMHNVINMGMSVDSVELFFEVMTMLSESDLMQFHLGNGFNLECWFASMAPPEMNATGFRIDRGLDRGIEVRKLLARLSGLKLSMDCIQCSSGLASLPEMVNIFERRGVTDILSYRLPLFLEEIAISDAMATIFDRWVVEAPYWCPHSGRYDLSYERPEEWNTPEFMEVSVEASDSIFFTVFALAEVGVVLLTETHAPWNLSSLDPLSSQELFLPEEGTDIIDLMDFGDSELGELLEDLADAARDHIGANRTDPKTNKTDVGINHIVRDFLLEDDGAVEVAAWFTDAPIEFSVEGMVITFHSIKIRGLDTFTRFDVLKPVAPQTVINSMYLKDLKIEVAVSAGRAETPQIVKAILDFENIEMTIPLFAAIDRNKFYELELGHFLQTNNLFQCALYIADSINFPQILMTIGNFSVPKFEGFLPDSGNALRESMQDVYDKYAARALKALPVVFDSSVRDFLNTFIFEYIRDEASCTHIKDTAQNVTLPGEEPYPFTDYIDFRELLKKTTAAKSLGALGNTTYGSLFRALMVPIQDELLWIDPMTNQAVINSVIRAGANMFSDFGEEGVMYFPGDLFGPVEVGAKIGALEAAVRIAAGDFEIRNLDTVGAPLKFLEPRNGSAHELQNSVGVGLAGRPLRFSMRISFGILTINGDTGVVDKDVQNDFVMSMDMANLEALFEVYALISENRTVHFPMRDFFTPACWLALLPSTKLDKTGVRKEGESSSLSIADLALAVERLNMTIACSNCTSPGMQALSDALASEQSADAITQIANSVFGFAVDLVGGNLVQDLLDRAINEAGRKCPHDPRYDASAVFEYEPLNFDRTIPTSSLLVLLISVGFTLVMMALIITVAVKFIVKRRHGKWIRTLPTYKVHILEHQQEADRQMENELNRDTTAMFTTSEIPRRVRYTMPLIIIGNIAFFVSGHVSIAAETAFEAQIAGESFTLDRFFAFSIMKSTVDMWEAGATEMAIFVLIFSGIWPYVKQITSLVCWFMPPSKLSITTRGSTFLWLDTLAKWSMVDIFVMIISMVSFRVNATTPDVPFLPKDFFSLSLVLIPRWGLYANLIAQLISQVSSHYIIYYHRTIVRCASHNYRERHISANKVAALLSVDEDSGKTFDDVSDHSVESSDDGQNRLCDSAFARPHKGESSKLVARQIASYGLVAGTSLLVVIFLVGASLPSLSVQIQGVVSFVSGAGDGVYSEFNIFGIAKQLMKDGINLGGAQIVGYFLLVAVFVSTVLIVPILQGLALAVHWFRPMNNKQRNQCSTFVEILSAWQYAEVYIIALIVASWQLAPTSETMMADQCSEFEYLFEMLAYYNIVAFQDSHCYRVEANIMSGTYFLITAALMLSILNSFVMKASFQYFWDKDSCRKEIDVKKQLAPEQASAPVDETVYKEIYPPPVLFTDAFRWMLRKEHLGDRPLQGIMIVEDPTFDTSREDTAEAMPSEEISGKGADTDGPFCGDDQKPGSPSSNPSDPSEIAV